MNRRRRTAAIGVLATILALGVVGWLALPSFIASELVRRAEERGFECRVEHVSVSLAGLRVRGLDLRRGGVLRANLDEVAVEAGLISLAVGGLDSIEGLVVRGGSIHVDAAGARSEAPIGRGATTSPLNDMRLPRVIAEGVSVEVRDELGALLTVESIHASWTEGEGAVRARGIGVGARPADTARIEALEISGPLSERRIDRLSMTEVGITLAEGSSVHVTADRLRRLRSVMGASDEEPEALDTRGSDLLRHFGASFRGTMSGVAVQKPTPSGMRDLLTQLECEITREGVEGLRTRGRGQPDLGGTLHWNLDVTPGALRVTGEVELEAVALGLFEPLLPEELPLYRPEEARLDAVLEIVSSGERLDGSGHLAIRDLGIFSTRIAPAPVLGIDLRMEGGVRFWPESQRLELAQLRIHSGLASVAAVGSLEWTTDHYLIDVDARLPATRCGDAISAIPQGFLEELSGFSLDGNISGALVAHIDSRELDRAVLSIQVSDHCEFEAVPALADLSRFEGPFHHRVEEPDGTIFEMMTGPGTEAWTPLAEMSPFMIHAVLGHEDAGFFRHAGFSTSAIRDALVRNLREGRYVVGASTISMQLVKNVFLKRQKTLARKVQEVLLTWWIETAWSKEAILELYLNVIEYGPSVYGIRNAAEHYFGVLPSELSPAQAAYLATILPNPRAYHAHWEAQRIPPSSLARISRFMRILGERGRYDATAVEEGLMELPVLRFHRAGDPRPEPRELGGRAAVLPFFRSTDHLWDEVLDGEVMAGDETSSEL